MPPNGVLPPSKTGACMPDLVIPIIICPFSMVRVNQIGSCAIFQNNITSLQPDPDLQTAIAIRIAIKKSFRKNRDPMLIAGPDLPVKSIHGGWYKCFLLAGRRHVRHPPLPPVPDLPEAGIKCYLPGNPMIS